MIEDRGGEGGEMRPKRPHQKTEVRSQRAEFRGAAFGDALCLGNARGRDTTGGKGEGRGDEAGAKSGARSARTKNGKTPKGAFPFFVQTAVGGLGLRPGQ